MDITDQLTHESRIALAAAAEITRLRAEVEALRADNRHLRGEFEKAWPDAERYRWLKSRAGFHEERDMGPGGDWLMAVGVSIRPAVNTLDAAIDAARAAQGERG